MSTIRWHLTKNSVIVTFGTEPKPFDRESDVGKKIIDCIKNNKLEDIPSLIDVKKQIVDNSNYLFYVDGGEIFSYGEKLPSFMTEKIFDYIQNGINFIYLIKFWNNLKMNPSQHVRENLPLFLEANNYTITQDGYFIAYKRVNFNFKDFWTGKMDNSPGKIVEEDRSIVDSDPNKDCSKGLHIAPYDYAKDFYQGSKGVMIELLVNPMDVIAIPYNYHHQKSRVCRYVVLRDISEKPEFKETSDISFVIVDGKLQFSNKVINDNEKEKDNITEKPKSIINTKINLEDTTKNKFLLKLGNYQYSYNLFTEGAVTRLGVNYIHVKPSKYPLAFTRTWGMDIVKVEKYLKDNQNEYNYIVYLKSGSIVHVFKL